ncbi:restriction endonuclease subunit S [Staphylococcus saprophyticus]|uniref:restriction endonuclease subunit S n=1 Tax=Staphylococcus saprophyticus TaxID=29385 RepID=UPI0012ADDB83|nr:restriction endonuclease subunit S [Staphylococcus saprophyticus]MRN64747.1 restriction endonuclease subunit S [Staphylococcus saprophyticus]
MTNEMSNVPELRFPEFDGEWEEKMLGEVTIYKNGSSFENSVKNHGVFNLITLKSVNTEGELINSGKYIDDKSTETLCKGTLVMILSEQAPGLVGMTANITRNNKYVLNQRVAALVPKQGIDSQFLSKLINRNQKYFSVRSAGTKVKNISKGHVENFNFLAPNYTEQQKIGNFFSKLDRQIELEEQKLSLLEEQKKGYMQKLFSQELRFKTKDNVYYSEWQLHKLGEIFKYSQGQQISVDKQFSVKSNEMKRFIRIVDITENPEPRFVLYESDTGLVNKEDLFMIRYGRPGIVSIGFEGIIANNLFKLIPKIKISTVYFYYLLSYNYYRINLLTNQSTMPALNFKSLDLLKFKIPSYKEQNKIGNFFTKFDELIEKQNQKIDGLKKRKKGFLQKMFI